MIDYAVYFDFDSIVVCDRQNHCFPFVTSPTSKRLDRCIFYLNEVCIRGTDYKYPMKFKAAITLENGLTKDRFVQAYVRIRILSNSHLLAFWSSYEVHQQITKLKIISHIENTNVFISLIDILRWAYENT